MVEIYSPPPEVGDPPPFVVSKIPYENTDAYREARNAEWRQHDQEDLAWIESVREWARRNGKGPHRGSVIRFGVGDGYAQYVVLTNTKLIHLPIGDAWNIDEYTRRGLRASDVAHLVASEKATAALFRDPLYPELFTR